MPFSKYDSSDFADISDSIEHAKTNELIASKASPRYKMGNFELQSPFSVYDEFWALIVAASVDYTMPEKFLYRPEKLAKALYGSRDLAFVLKRLNGVTTSRDFTSLNIKIFDPGETALIGRILSASSNRITRYNTSTRTLEDLTIKPVLS